VLTPESPFIHVTSRKAALRTQLISLVPLQVCDLVNSNQFKSIIPPRNAICRLSFDSTQLVTCLSSCEGLKENKKQLAHFFEDLFCNCNKSYPIFKPFDRNYKTT